MNDIYKNLPTLADQWVTVATTAANMAQQAKQFSKEDHNGRSQELDEITRLDVMNAFVREQQKHIALIQNHLEEIATNLNTTQSHSKKQRKIIKQS